MNALKNIARKLADAFGAWYLTGPGTKRLGKLLPRPILHSLDASWNNVLVLAPHPDDEVFGAGLLLARLLQQKLPVTIAYITNGGAYSTGAGGDRKEEAQAYAKSLGAKGIFLDLKDGQLQNTPGLEDKIYDLMAEIQPDAVILPWFGDYHTDHRAVARAAIRRPYIQAQYLFYSTFSPLWPGNEFKLSFIMGGEQKVRDALAGYSASVNQETINGFMTLRRALARGYLNNDAFWEPFLEISGTDMAGIGELAATWPQVYPTLKKARHWRACLQDLAGLKGFTTQEIRDKDR